MSYLHQFVVVVVQVLFVFVFAVLPVRLVLSVLGALFVEYTLHKSPREHPTKKRFSLDVHLVKPLVCIWHKIQPLFEIFVY